MRGLFCAELLFCVCLPTYAAGDEAAKTLVVQCGPGLGNCGPNASPDSPVWAAKAPGVFQLIGSDITVTYEADQDVFYVEWHGNRRIRLTAPDAESTAKEWRDKLASLGIKP
jgi:hypothetical protein